MAIRATPQQLAAFLKVSETSSFSEAAVALAISQPALSRTIRVLENALGSRLFDRDTRNVTLTPAGLELRPIAKRILGEFDSSFAELARFVSGKSGRISVAALPSMAAVLLPHAVSSFYKEFPEVDFQIIDALSGSVQDIILDGGAELGLTVRPKADGQLVYHQLMSDTLGLVCKKDDPLAGVPEVNWDLFTTRPFIAMAPGSSVRAATDAAFLQRGLAVAPLFECGFLATARALVNAELGITALPSLSVPLIAEAGLIWRPLKAPLIRRSLGIIHRHGITLTPASVHFIDHLLSVAERFGENDAVAGGT